MYTHSMSTALTENNVSVAFLPSLFLFIWKLFSQPFAQFSHAFAVVHPSLPVSQVPSMLLGQAVKSPFAWSTQTTVSLSCQDITTSKEDH